jgi:hypothetical protein
MSRAAWYRRNKARRRGETTLSAAIFLSSEDRPVSPEGGAGLSERRCRAEERKRLSVLADGDHDAADIYGALSPEAGLLALGLKISGAKIACAA